MKTRTLIGLVLVVVFSLAVLVAGALLLHVTPPEPAPSGPPARQGASAPLRPAPVMPGAHHRRASHDRVPAGTPGVGMGRVLLRQLTVAAHEQGPAYQRAEYGTAWSDTDNNRCDTRNDVLTAWLVDTQTHGCSVTEGRLVDPYTGNHISHPSQVDIDHVVSLGDAWRSGAARWTKDRRTEFANDVRHLVPTSASANRTKGDKAAEQWLPPDPGYHCDYGLIVIATKHAYRLTVTVTERNALDLALMTC